MVLIHITTSETGTTNIVDRTGSWYENKRKSAVTVECPPSFHQAATETLRWCSSKRLLMLTLLLSTMDDISWSVDCWPRYVSEVLSLVSWRKSLSLPTSSGRFHWSTSERETRSSGCYEWNCEWQTWKEIDKAKDLKNHWNAANMKYCIRKVHEVELQTCISTTINVNETLRPAMNRKVEIA